MKEGQATLGGRRTWLAGAVALASMIAPGLRGRAGAPIARVNIGSH